MNKYPNTCRRSPTNRHSCSQHIHLLVHCSIWPFQFCAIRHRPKDHSVHSHLSRARRCTDWYDRWPRHLSCPVYSANSYRDILCWPLQQCRGNNFQNREWELTRKYASSNQAKGNCFPHALQGSGSSSSIQMCADRLGLNPSLKQCLQFAWEDNKVIRLKCNYLRPQLSPWQSRDSSAGPEQTTPPWAGGGLVQVRLRFSWPSPHFALHSP